MQGSVCVAGVSNLESNLSRPSLLFIFAHQWHFSGRCSLFSSEWFRNAVQWSGSVAMHRMILTLVFLFIFARGVFLACYTLLFLVIMNRCARISFCSDALAPKKAYLFHCFLALYNSDCIYSFHFTMILKRCEKASTFSDILAAARIIYLFYRFLLIFAHNFFVDIVIHVSLS